MKIVFGLGGHQVKAFSREDLITGEDYPPGEDLTQSPTHPLQDGPLRPYFSKFHLQNPPPGEDE